MTDNVYAILATKNKTGIILNNGFTFHFVKERYTPYTHLHLKFYNSYKIDYPITYVSLYINSKLVHFGLVDTCEYICENNTYSNDIYSKGFTSLLTQNQMTPGLVSDISLNSLMTDYYTIPEITYEDDAEIANYIFCKDGSTMWNAVENLTQKLYDTYPYIRGTNCVRMSAPDDVITVTPTDIISRGTLRDYRRVVSHYHMQDINGDYGVYNSTNALANECAIVRHKEISLDKQFLNDPTISLGHKMKFCMRGYFSKYIEYAGYLGEDLCDRITCADWLDNAEISKIDVYGNGKYIKTRIDCYFDEYCNLS